MRLYSILVPLAVLGAVSTAAAQGAPRTLVAVFAHPDDESAAGPVLARYAREGAEVHLIIATDGAAGTQQTSIAGGAELARVRAAEARCAAEALGIRPPVLLEFPDGQLGAYAAEPVRLFRLTERLHAELQRLRPQALITWGPDGGTGHPDHRLVSSIVTQLVRAAAAGVPERLFYASVPAEAMRAVNAGRGVPPVLLPDARHLTARIPVSAADLEAAGRALACHKSQFPPETVARLTEAAKQMWNGVLSLAPASPAHGGADLFR